MSVELETARVAYSGSGSTGPFSIPFYFLANSHIRAVKLSSSTETVLTLTTDYSLTGAGDEDGGTLTLVVALASGETLTITRNVPLTQETNWPIADPFPAASHEQAADKLTMIVQQIDDTLGRTLRQPVSDATALAELPIAASRASMALTFDANGQPLMADISGSVLSFSPTTEAFDGTGAQTAFTLANSPTSASAVIVRIDGVVQTPITDYTVSGTTLTFTTAPATGTGNIVVQNFGIARELNTVAVDNVSGLGDSDGSSKVGFVQSGSASSRSVESKLRERVTVTDYMTDAQRASFTAADRSLDLAAPYQNAIDACVVGGELIYPPGDLRVDSQINWNKKLKHRGATASREGATGNKAVGSLISGSGITVIRATEPFIAEDLAIYDPVGHADTIALDINDGENGVVNWELRNVYLHGTTDRVGIGLRGVFAMKGIVSGAEIIGWGKGVALTQHDTNAKSNAIDFQGVKIRVNDIGLSVEGSDDVFVGGSTIEGNRTGISQASGKVTLSRTHLENNQGATPTNVTISAGNFVSLGSFYAGTGATRDIVVTAGAGIHTSIADTFNGGVTHGGTGVMHVFAPVVAFTVSGAGPVIEYRDTGVRATNRSGNSYIISGFANLTLQQPILKVRTTAGTPAQITADQNNYDLGTSGWRRLSSNASRTITGFVAGLDGDEVLLVNVGAQDIVIANQDTASASTAANRVITGTGASITLAPDDTALIKYDGTNQRWRVLNTH